MSGPDRQERLVPLDQVGAELMKVPGTTMTFEVERDEMTLANQQGTTFSQDGLEKLVDGFRAWIYTRAFRELNAAGPMLRPTHRKARATVTFLIDDAEEDPVVMEMSIVDGELRIAAAAKKDER